MDTTVKNILLDTLKSFPSIQLAILFGSVAIGRAKPDSDIDLAILAATPISADQKIKFIETLATATGRAIDLIDLNTAGQPLLGQIISHGERIMGSDTLYAQLMTKNLFDQADFLPLRNRILDERRALWINK